MLPLQRALLNTVVLRIRAEAGSCTTSSVAPRHNAEVVRAFLDEDPDFQHMDPPIASELRDGKALFACRKAR